MSVEDSVRLLREELESRRRKVRALEDELVKAREEEEDLRRKVEDLLGSDPRTNSSARRERVLEIVRSNERVTLTVLASAVGVSVSTVKSDLSRLGRDGLYPVPLQSDDDEVGRRRNLIAHSWKYDHRVTSEATVAEVMSLPLDVVEADVAWLEEAGYIEVDRDDEEATAPGPPGGPGGPTGDPSPSRESPSTPEVGQAPLPDSSSPDVEPRVSHCQDSTLVGRRERVAALLGEGKSLDEISSTLDVSRKSVGQDVRFLKLRERMGAAEKKSSPGSPPPRDLTAAPPVSPGGGGEDEVDEENEYGGGGKSMLRAASREELEAEVARQLRGERQGRATLTTTTSRAHSHVAEVGSSGDGRTLPDGTGHVHVVERLYLRPSQKHQHDLAVPVS